MSTKQTILGMTALFLLCMGYYLYLDLKVWPKHPEWFRADTTTEQTQLQPSTEESPSAFGPTTSPSTQASISSSTMPSGLQAVVTGPISASVIIGSTQPKDPTYALGMAVSPLAAGLDSVTVNSFKDIDANGLYVFQQPIDSASAGSLATGNLSIDGRTIDLSRQAWGLESSSRDSATFGLQIDGIDHKPLLHVTKTFQLKTRGPNSNRDQTAAGYTTELTYHLQNISGKTLNNVQIDTAGPTMPPREMERYEDRQIVSGYDRGDQNVEFNRDMLSEFKPESADKDITVYKGFKFLWAGTSSNYFAAIVLPENAGALSQVQIHCLNPAAPSDERLAEIDFKSAPLSIAPAATADLPLSVFFGPKDRALLEGDFYSSFPRYFNQLLATSSSMCAFCSFPWLVDGLVDLLRAFHFVLRDWGLAIIALVILVRAILHPISKHSQVSMMRLQKMGPEMERLKKKFANDKEGLAKAQMEMHKEMGIAPFLGCLPMFLQMPIWIALYSALQNDIALRQAPFLWGLTWIHDLARPDRLIHWDSHPFIVPILGMKVVSLNVLPLVVAVLMFIQQKLNPQAPAITPEQQQQQKMMRYMSLLFSLFFYWMPSGLNLYILTSSTIAIFESKIIRKHVKEKEEEEKRNRVIIDAKPTRQGKQNKTDRDNLNKSTTRQGWLARMWGQLQEKAEEVRRDAEKKPPKR